MPLMTSEPELHLLRLPPAGWPCDHCNDIPTGDAYAYFIEHLRPDSSKVTLLDAQLVVCGICAVELGDEEQLPE